MQPTILTHSGHYLNFLNPDFMHININDIAHALANLCRFTGHTREFYSVAQHSVIVSHLVAPEHALRALLHDASEAYIGDLSSPLKSQSPSYCEIERNLQAKIIEVLTGSTEPDHPSIKHADLIALATERRDLMPHNQQHWPILNGITPMATTIKPLAPSTAHALFTARYRELTQKTALQQLRNIIANDSLAASHQTLGQYRSSLLKTVDALGAANDS